ncbi:SGNH/GDSL hydrolase family protein [Microbacterium sp. LWO13-1.2]|uniref:SGNH/GDSL hydrolase family protein n=1 Tax=Microbacterium sp. LWO13-1.2 TaxID=3135262 RepID=UPI003139F8CB
MDHLDRIVFIGDSITDAGRDRADPASLGDGYVSLLADGFAAQGATVRNLGISGNRAKDLAARWDAELMPTGPDLLTVYVGVNDMWRRFDSGDPTSAADFESTLRALLTQVVEAHRPRLILMEPFFLPVLAEQQEWLPDLDEKRAVVRSLAAEFGAELVPLHDIFTAAASEHPIADLAPDGVHPTRLGSEIIADAWREAALARDAR